MNRPTDGEIIQWLKSSSAYSGGVDVVEDIETHCSRVFLVGDFVYKLKKPVHFDFLDLRELSAREHACREELRLNRRLAPNAYLEVVALTCDEQGRLALGGAGTVVDWLVKMRRLPRERMANELIRRGELRQHHIVELAQVLRDFYHPANCSPVSPEVYRQRCVDHVRENLRVLRQLMPADLHDAIDRGHTFQLQLLHTQPELFDQRVLAQRIVEGHGDLRPEHVCFTNPLAIFDCIEFGKDFREIDTADELAFFAEECDCLGAAWVGPYLFEQYERLTGDHVPLVVLDLYKSYRASVRAKVAALRAQQLGPQQQASALREAEKYVQAADRYARLHRRPLMLVVGGLSGSGKSTLARELARQLAARLLSSDELRRDLFGSSETHRTDKYSIENRERVYAEMLSRARALHRAGLSVVMDATFADPQHLHAAWALSQEPHSRFLAIECHCPLALIRDRIESRRLQGTDASEATLRVLEAQRIALQAWPASIPQLSVETSQPLTHQAATVIARLSADAVVR